MLAPNLGVLDKLELMKGDKKSHRCWIKEGRFASVIPSPSGRSKEIPTNCC